jgi:protoporphyrinogen oxidase
MFRLVLCVGLWLGSWITTPAVGDQRPIKCPKAFSFLATPQKGETWLKTPKRKIPILLRGADEASFDGHSGKTPLNEIPEYDTVVVGGGLSGLTAGVYLTDKPGHKTLLLEKEPLMGGLAAGGERWGARYARGAAYFSPPEGDQVPVFEHIGLSDYKNRFEIKAPIDSYLWNGKLYHDVWEPEALSELPKSFALFKLALQKVDDKIPTQPMESSGQLQWDHLSAAEWVRSIPRRASHWKDPEARKLYEAFKNDPRLDRKDPMKEVIEFLNLFSRSALGWETDHVSATAFTNFYISEISERYTGTTGSGDIAQRLGEILKERSADINVRSGSAVRNIRQDEDGVEVTYERDGELYTVRSKRLIFSAPLGQAPKLIPALETDFPAQAKLLSGLEYAHYSVHNVFVEGHPWRDSYDLWMRDRKYTDGDPTDVILGRWQDPKIYGYSGMRDFQKDPRDGLGILTVYHPLPKEAVGSGYTDAQAIEVAEQAVERTEAMLGPLLRDRWGTSIKVKAIETNRWPYSIHIVKPGWLTQAKSLTAPLGHIYLANNNMGVPSVEEAMYRGRTAAQAVLKSLEEQQTVSPSEKSRRQR